MRFSVAKNDTRIADNRRPSASSNGRSPSWSPEASELIVLAGDDVEGVVGGGTTAENGFLRQQADEAEPMKQPPSTLDVNNEMIVELENGYEVENMQMLVALKFAQPPAEQHPSLTVDDFA